MLRASHCFHFVRPSCALAVLLVLTSLASAQRPDSKLMDAVGTHDNAAVQQLLAQGGDPNASSKNGRTPLIEAGCAGYMDTTRILLEHGADVNAKDNVGWTALFWAAFSRHTDTLRLLIAKGADVNARDNEGRTALFWSSFYGQADVMRVLLDHGAHINARDNYGWTALMSAVDLGHADAAKVLLDQHADVQIRAKDGSTALRLAEKYKYDNLVALLRDASRVIPGKSGAAAKSGTAASSNVATSAAASSKPQPDNSPMAAPSTASRPAASPSKSDLLNEELLQSAEAGDTAQVLALIREGAGVNARGVTYGNTPLMAAASRGHTDLVRTLIEKGADVDGTDNAGRTALMEAAFEGSTTARVLLENDAAINAQDKDGWTPLFWAAFSRRTDTVRFLLANGANVNAENKYQDTPLIHAAYAGDTDTVAVLLENHADTNAQDDMGRTALLEAARQGHLDTVRELLKHGASESVQANDGSTALSMAEKLHFAEIAALLKNPPSTAENTNPASVNPPVRKPPEPQAPETRDTMEPPAPVAPTILQNTEPPADSSPKSNPLATATKALEKKSRAQAFYRMGLSMRLLEEYWPQNSRIGERAAASILGDLTKVAAPDDLVSLAQQASTRLAVPPEERKGSISDMISELHDRMNKFCYSQAAQKFFYSAGAFTYDMNLLGQELRQASSAEDKNEQARINLSPLATNLVQQCSGVTDCKIRALPYISDSANLLQQSPLHASDGDALKKLSDQISIALGTDEPLTDY
jgi:ankyrin repeat protein